MKSILLFFLFAVVFTGKVFSQLDSVIFKYFAFTIPDSTKKNADAVYRLDEGLVDITSPSRYSFKVHNIVTLLNKNAQHHLNHSIHFDKFIKVENVEIKIYDALGLLVKKYSRKDFLTTNYDDRMSLYTDDKLLHLETAAPGYPCTVETSYEYRTTGYINLPGWNLVSPGEVVEHSRFIVKVPAGLNIRHLTTGMELQPTVDTTAGSKIYTWLANNIKVESSEADAYGVLNPHIQISPEVFEYDGYKGDMKTWKSYGEWSYQLFTDPKPFNKAQTEEILTAVSICKTEREKVKVLYERLKQNMRYVSIQLGIGGYKPFPVQYVHEKKFGDCKALTNYMRYMLKAAGINAYPALVNAGYNKLPANPDFPSQVFNHVILCVPLNNDTIWLECTSKNNECGVLGNFTENKNALLLTEHGGVLIATPKSNYYENLLSTKTIINVDQDGGSKATSNIYCKGDFWDMFYEILQQTNEGQKSIFVNSLSYRNPEHFTFIAKGDSAEGKLFSVDLDYDQQYDFKTGSKIFFPQKINRLCTVNLTRTLSRKHDYIFNFPYERIDTTIFILPVGTTIDNLPLQKEVSNNYISYNNTFVKNQSGNIITVIGRLSLKKHIIPSEDYAEVMDYLSQVNQNEREKIVLKKG